MMHLGKLVQTQTGKYVLSVILGLGLASLFRTVCKGTRCKIISSPPLTEIDGQTYKFNDKCYTFEKQSISCKSNKKTVNIA